MPLEHSEKKMKIIFLYNDENAEFLVKKSWFVGHDVDCIYSCQQAFKLLTMNNQYDLIVAAYSLYSSNDCSGLLVADFIEKMNLEIPLLILDTECNNESIQNITKRNLPLLRVPFSKEEIKEKIKEIIH